MSEYYELYGSRSLNQDEVKCFLQDCFGYFFQGRQNDNDGPYWLHDENDIHIKVQNNIDLGDNLPRLEEFKAYPVLVYLSLFKIDRPSNDEFVQKLHQNGIELLGRLKYMENEWSVLFGNLCSF